MRAQDLIPDEAFDAAEKVAKNYVSRTMAARDAAFEILRDSVPIVMVSELTKLAELLRGLRAEAKSEDGRSVRASGIGEAIALVDLRVADWKRIIEEEDG